MKGKRGLGWKQKFLMQAVVAGVGVYYHGGHVLDVRWGVITFIVWYVVLRAPLGTALTYKFNREFSLKGEYRYDQLHSNSPGANYHASAFLVGLKLQR